MRAPLSLAALAFAGAALLPASPAGAQQPTANLRDALAQLPETILSGPEPFLASFVDVPALGVLAGGAPEGQFLWRAGLAGDLRPVETLLSVDAARWSEAAGIALAEMRYFAGFGQPPERAAVWGLDGAEAAEGLVARLAEAGFEPVEGFEGIFANGEPMAQDLAAREPANPWRGPLGQTSAIAASGDAVLQGQDPEAVAALRDPSAPSAAENAIVIAALDGLDAAVGDGIVVQAALFSPVAGLSAGDPAAAILADAADPDAARAALEEAMADAGSGIAPYLAGVMADVQFGDEAGLVISLVPNAGSRMRRPWPR